MWSSLIAHLIGGLLDACPLSAQLAGQDTMMHVSCGAAAERGLWRDSGAAAPERHEQGVMARLAADL